MSDLCHVTDAKDVILNVLREDPSDPENSSQAAINSFKREDERTRPHIELNVEKEPETLIASIIVTDATTKYVWKKFTEEYQKENFQ